MEFTIDGNNISNMTGQGPDGGEKEAAESADDKTKQGITNPAFVSGDEKGKILYWPKLISILSIW